MMAKKQKTKIPPISQKSSRRIKDISIPTVDDNNKLCPLFSLEYLDPKYCISKCEKDEKASFADTLRIIGQLTWNELIKGGKHQNGCETIRIEQIKRKKPLIITDDVKKVLAFRFHDRKAVVGHRIGRVFYIIWLDRDFSLYNH